MVFIRRANPQSHSPLLNYAYSGELHIKKAGLRLRTLAGNALIHRFDRNRGGRLPEHIFQVWRRLGSSDNLEPAKPDLDEFHAVARFDFKRSADGGRDVSRAK